MKIASVPLELRKERPSMQIRTRLAISFSVILILNAVLAGISINRMSVLQDNLDAIVKDNIHKIASIESMRHAVVSSTGKMRDLIIMKDEKLRTVARKKMEAELGVYFSTLEDLGKSLKDPDEKQHLQAILDVQQAAVPRYNVTIKLAVEGNQEKAAETLAAPDMAPLEDALVKALDDMVKLQIKRADDAARHAETEYEKARLTAVLVTVAAIAVGALIAWLVGRDIFRPLAEAAKITEKVSEGNLNIHVNNRWRNEFGSLIDSMTHMANNLNLIVSEVRNSTKSIAISSDQVAEGNADLSQRTEQQSRHIQDTAASMEELTSTVKLNTENAVEADRLAARASNIATESGKAVSDVVQRMQTLNTTTGQMLGIVNTIERIAFQTKILALNASVEAARAGESGRGFAIVAAEVSNLAQNSTAAAHEIKTLIEESVARILGCTELAANAGTTMQNVVQSVSRVAQIIEEIARASAEQNAGLEHINRAIVQIEATTEKNALLAEESTNSTITMREQVERLDHAVSAFQTKS